MPISLNFVVVNSAVIEKESEVEVNGQLGKFTSARKYVELVPVNHAGGTLTLDLEPTVTGFEISSLYTVTIEQTAV